MKNMLSIQILGLEEDINRLNIIHVAGTKGKVLFSLFVMFFYSFDQLSICWKVTSDMFFGFKIQEQIIIINIM